MIQHQRRYINAMIDFQNEHGKSGDHPRNLIVILDHQHKTFVTLGVYIFEL